MCYINKIDIDIDNHWREVLPNEEGTEKQKAEGLFCFNLR